MTVHLTIIRHGTTEWMEQGLTHGRMDAPLSALGWKQAQATADALRGRQFDAFYSSPTGRAWQTANIITDAIGMTPTPLESLMEQDFGSLEGTVINFKPSPQMMLGMLLAWVIPFGNGGETIGAVYRRGVETLDRMLKQHPGGKIALVSHSGLINMMLKKISGRRFAYFHIHPASITEVELHGNGMGKILTDVQTSFAPRAM